MNTRVRHGESHTRLYRIFRGMMGRCYTKGDGSYPYYGQKGIFICEEWKNSYINFREWANKNGYADNLTIDRVNNNGCYSPENCRWITQHEQVIRQERFSHRKMEDKYIKEVSNGRFSVTISKRRHTQKSIILDTLEQARVERNFLEFCVDNDLNYKYPFPCSPDITKGRKSNPVKRSENTKLKVCELLKDGTNIRVIAKRLKIPSSKVIRISKEAKKESAEYLYSRVDALLRLS